MIYFPLSKIIAIKLVAISSLFLTTISLFAQNIQNNHEGKRFAEQQNIIQLSASASVEVQQDVLTINLSTTREGADANAVQAQLKLALDTALTDAKRASMPGLIDVRTGNFNLYPRYGKDSKINGWQGTTELVIEGRDFVKISALAGKIQNLTIANLSFSLSREQRAKAETEAQGLAIERFRSKATEIVKSFGMTSYTLREVAVNAGDQGYTPRPTMRGMQVKEMSASADVPVEAGKSTVVVTVSGAVQMR